MDSKTLLIMAMAVGLATSANAFLIDFETEDDFATVLLNGQIVDPAFDAVDLEFGNLFDLTTLQGPGGGHIGATVYDSTPGTNVDDSDLQVATGNILILQNPKRGATVAGANGLEYDRPDDAAVPSSGSFIFDFSRGEEEASVSLRSIDPVDIDAGSLMQVILTDTGGRTRTYTVPENFTNDVTQAIFGIDTLRLTGLGLQVGEGGGVATAVQDFGFKQNSVDRLEVKLIGDDNVSGGIDNLVFAQRRPFTPPPRSPFVPPARAPSPPPAADAASAAAPSAPAARPARSGSAPRARQGSVPSSR